VIIYIYGFLILVGVITVVHWGTEILRNLLCRIVIFWKSRDYVAALERIADELEQQRIDRQRHSVEKETPVS
jgi:hypothetical protein